MESIVNIQNSIDLDDPPSFPIKSSISSITSLRVSKSRYEDHVRILATLVPDEIIYRDTTTSDMGTNLNGVLLFVDVSGFTDMCERYQSIGKGGPSKITQVLNAYIGAMVQEIMSHNGDVMKFSGDAFLALWKSNDDVSMSDVVHAAIDCALGIQRSHGTYKTEVDIILRVKIALAAGPITFSVIGVSNFMILGPTMLDVKGLGNLCGPGEILISHTIKIFLSPNEYICEEVHDYSHQKIISIGSEWTPSTISNQFELFDAFAVTTTKKERTDAENESDMVEMDSEDRPDYFSYMLRPSLDYAAANNLNQYLRNFIIPPVVKAIDLNEPLDFLTEMRQVVIVFINVILAQTNRMDSLVNVCNVSYNIVCDMVLKGGGCVNKVSMFDKDLMFLVIFGLRGFKHTFEAQRALYCGQNIIVKLQNVPLVESASVGVCTGMTYCGVVGHPMRKEYTVIGRTVNKAARIMVKYPDIVSCDRQTFLQSQLQAKYFALQPARALKGFKNVGPIYKYYDRTSKEEAVERELTKVSQYPLLDRQREMELFFYYLMLKTYNSNSETSISTPPWPYVSNVDFEYQYNMIIISGRERQGKTRLLHEIMYYINESLSYNLISFSWGDTNKPYRLFRSLFSDKIGITDTYNNTNLNERTNKVRRFLQPFKVPEFLCALNDILGVNFEVTKYYLRLTDDQKLYVKRKMIKYLCIKGYKDKGLLLIDNMEFMDEKTWNLFKVLLKIDWLFICATMGNYGLVGQGAKKIISRPDVKVIKLEPVKKLFHSGLICQDLNVMGVSLELERYIQVHSRGNPGWIESFLTTLCDSGVVKIKEMDKYVADANGYVIAPFDMVSRNVVSKKITTNSMLINMTKTSFAELFSIEIEDWDIIHQTIKALAEENNHDDQNISKETPSTLQICDLPKNVNLEDMETEDILDVNMIQTYDSLKVQEQLLLKCSSILGDSFSRVMLEYIMQSQSHIKNAEAIQKLFEIRVFSCGRAKYTNGAIQVDHYLADPNENTSIACYCTGFPVNPITFFLPPYANCGFIRFREPMFRQMLINLLTESQANLYHVRSMWFLESQTKRCLDCGLGYFTTLIGQCNDDVNNLVINNKLCWVLVMQSL